MPETDELLRNAPLERRPQAEKDLADLRSTGVTVHRVDFPEDDEPRFFFTFPPHQLQYQVRAQLEKLLFDISAKMGAPQLTFYACRRTKQGKGWEV